MNQKKILIPTLILFGVMALGSLSNAYALFTMPATDAHFGISQEIEYYLKGTFNSWSQSNTYRFVNNTGSMDPEENKIKEYKLENIPLDKAAELKIWANNDSWFKDGANNCTYEHHWTNDESFSANDDHNYIVPMTSNTYSFYLKFYSDGSSKIYVTANKDILYFIPSTYWKRDSATFAIERYNNSDEWVSNVTDGVESPSGTFKFEVGTTYTKYKFARRNTTNESTWDASSIQTISNVDTNNCYSLWDTYYGSSTNIDGGWNADSNAGSWSTK